MNLIPDRPVQVAAVDGRDLDPENGIYHQSGITTKTLWGEIAYQVGGVEGYRLLQGSDRSSISPGTDVLDRLLNGKPTVIIWDKIARYLRAAKAKQIGRSDLAEQVVAFLFSLMDLASACSNLVFVYSLASASDTFAEETTELQELIRASARQERVLSPSTDVEIYNIVKQRLFTSVSGVAAEKAASEYFNACRASRVRALRDASSRNYMRTSPLSDFVNLPDACKDARYSQAIALSQPSRIE